MLVTVLGAGTMGHGIAQASAAAGHDVVLRDVDSSILDDALEQIERNLQKGVELGKVTAAERDATLERVRTEESLEAAVSGADLVVEAVPERMDLKKEVLTEVEAVAPADAVLGTNTSSLSVTELASALDDPSRVVGLHFFNPVHLLDLVEIVVAQQTDDQVRRRAEEYVEGLGKNAVTVNDNPGFASSRLSAHIGLEAMRMLEAGVTTADDIDTVCEEGFNFAMGPLTTADVVGLDVRLDVLEYLRAELGERFRPPQILKNKVRAGNLGRKTGEGFYVWDGDERGEPVDR
jgi:3-hydroxybutyryl-CoA dehydrogenase